MEKLVCDRCGAEIKPRQKKMLSMHLECGLPAKGEYDWVLVLVKLEPDGFVGLPHIAELRRGVWYATEYEEPIEKILSAKVTHWMPLPEKASFGAIKQEADHA